MTDDHPAERRRDRRPDARPGRPRPRPRWRASLAAIEARDAGSTRSPWCSPTRRASEAAVRDAGPAAGEPRPAVRRTGGDQGGDRRRRLRDDVRRPRQHARPAAADGEVVRRLRDAGAVVIGKTHDAGVRRVPVHRVGRRAATPATPGTCALTPGGSSGGTAVAVAAGMVPVGMGGDGGGSIRIPSACCGLFGLKPQRGRVTTAPHEHLWWALGTAGPLTRTVLDSAIVYDVIRGNLPTDRWHGGRGRLVHRGRRREPGRLRVGWSAKPVTRGVRPARRRTSRPSVTPPGCSPTSATRCARSTRTTPTRPRRSCRSSSPASAPRPTQVEHYERLERRTRETCRLGAWVTPAVIDVALRPTERVSAKANRVFDDGGRAAHPDHRAPAAAGRRARPDRHRPGVAQAAAGDRVRRAVERRRQPGGVGARGHGRRRAAGRRAAGRAAPTTRRPCSAWRPSSRPPAPGRWSRRTSRVVRLRSRSSGQSGGRPDQEASRLGPSTQNAMPAGSISVAIRPYGVSSAAETTSAPIDTAFAVASSVSATCR